jgi:hypothetical protein
MDQWCLCFMCGEAQLGDKLQQAHSCIIFTAMVSRLHSNERAVLHEHGCRIEMFEGVTVVCAFSML